MLCDREEEEDGAHLLFPTESAVDASGIGTSDDNDDEPRDTNMTGALRLLASSQNDNGVQEGLPGVSSPINAKVGIVQRSGSDSSTTGGEFSNNKQQVPPGGVVVRTGFAFMSSVVIFFFAALSSFATFFRFFFRFFRRDFEVFFSHFDTEVFLRAVSLCYDRISLKPILTQKWK